MAQNYSIYELKTFRPVDLFDYSNCKLYMINRLLAVDFEKSGFSAYGVAVVSTPLTNYTPDYFPLSIGMASTNVAARLTGNYHLKSGWYVNASGAYTMRSNVKLDRPS